VNVRSAYLDTSAIVKRYVVEEHTARVDELYNEAHAGRITIGFSVWNIGEVAVVLDKYQKRGFLNNARAVFEKFIGETRFLIKINQLKLISLNSKTMILATSYVFKHGIYIADAVQLASAKGFDEFLSFDKEIAQIARIEGFNVKT